MSTNIDSVADVLLADRARRQATVDRALARSVWDRFLERAVEVAICGGIFVIVTSVLWPNVAPTVPRPEVAEVGSILVLLALWRSQRRLRAVSTILERTGALERFVGDADLSVSAR